jgi:hypothetical protein
MIDWPRYARVGQLPSDALLLQNEGVLISTTFEQPTWDESYQPQPGESLVWSVLPGQSEKMDRWRSTMWDFVKPQALAFSKNNADGSGLWTLAQSNSFLTLPAGEMARTLEVELYRAIPVPSRETPIEEVLELRRRRSDELRAYRGAIDDLYLEIIRSPDIPFAKNRAVEKLQQSVVDLHRVMSETRMGQSVVSVKVDFNPLDPWEAIFRAGTLGGVGFNFGLTAAALGAAAGLASAAIRLRPQQVRRLPNIPRELSAYAYLATIEAELGRAEPPLT